MKKGLIAGIALASILAVSPLVVYASGVAVGSYTTTSVGDIRVDKDGGERIHIYSSDIDYLASETAEMIARRDEYLARVDALLAEYERICQRDGVTP